MKIYLDTKDIIELFQNSSSAKVEEFKDKLVANGHELVLSLTIVRELTAPLLIKNANTNVMSLLNKIDEAPLCYIRHDKVGTFELEEAIKSIKEGRECNQISPIVNRPVELFDTSFPPVNASLSKLIFNIWTQYSESLKPYEKSSMLAAIIENDRLIDKRPSLNKHFKDALKKQFINEGLQQPEEGFEELVNWIYGNPRRCPSIRLGYEMYHTIVKNVNDIIKNGDLHDITNIKNLPYVDLMTLDRRMKNYVIQVDRALGIGYKDRLCSNVNELMERI